MKKPRADAKLKTLAEGVQAQLWDALTATPEEGGQPMTYAAARVWLESVHGVETSSAALSEWYAWYGLALRSARAKSRAAQAAAMAAKDDPTLTSADLERLGQMVFTAEAIEGGDVRDYVQLMRLRIQERALAIDERRIVLLETKARQADAAESVMKDSQLSEEEKGAKMRSIFGME